MVAQVGVVHSERNARRFVDHFPFDDVGPLRPVPFPVVGHFPLAELFRRHVLRQAGRTDAAVAVAHVRCLDVPGFAGHGSRRIAHRPDAAAHHPGPSVAVFVDLQTAGLLVALLAADADHHETDENGHQEDDEENDDQSDADAQRVRGRGGTGDAVAASGQDAPVVDDSVEDAARAVQRLHLAVDGKVGQTSFEFCKFIKRRNKSTGKPIKYSINFIPKTFSLWATLSLAAPRMTVVR